MPTYEIPNSKKDGIDMWTRKQASVHPKLGSILVFGWHMLWRSCAGIVHFHVWTASSVALFILRIDRTFNGEGLPRVQTLAQQSDVWCIMIEYRSWCFGKDIAYSRNWLPYRWLGIFVHVTFDKARLYEKYLNLVTPRLLKVRLGREAVNTTNIFQIDFI